MAYTPEEDAAILSYVSKHKSEIGGNRLWQQMEKQHVTSRSWQSMKGRYRVLAPNQSEIEEVETTEEELKATEEETKVINYLEGVARLGMGTSFFWMSEISFQSYMMFNFFCQQCQVLIQPQ